MPLDVVACRPETVADLRAVVADPSLAGEFAWLVASGELRNPFDHPHVDPQGIWLAFDDRRPVGFCMLMLWPSTRGFWSMVRLGVVETHRRRGVGRDLLGKVNRRLDALPPERRPLEVCLSAWQPNPAAEAFATRHGFTPARWFWSMERPRGPAAPVTWPDGVDVLPFDGSDVMLRHWNDCYNDSFAENYLTVSSTVDDCRAITKLDHFRPDGLLLAYRDGACVGFCRNALYPDFGEIDVLGVARAARGIGLGRALLRWGVGWLESRAVPHVRLMVDAENETALRLYRSEGFDTVRTRRAWARRNATA
jgi:mycothiol synthase